MENKHPQIFKSVLVFILGCVSGTIITAFLEFALLQNIDRYLFNAYKIGVSNGLDSYRLIILTLILVAILWWKYKRKAFLIGFILSAVALIGLYIAFINTSF